MKYYLDCEYIECNETIQMISLALLSESGEELYEFSAEYDYENASDDEKVNSILELYEQVIPREKRINITIDSFHKFEGKSLEAISKLVIKMIYDDEDIKIHSYSNPHSVVLFGRLITEYGDFKKNINSIDLNQILECKDIFLTHNPIENVRSLKRRHEDFLSKCGESTISLSTLKTNIVFFWGLHVPEDLKQNMLSDLRVVLKKYL